LSRKAGSAAQIKISQRCLRLVAVPPRIVRPAGSGAVGDGDAPARRGAEAGFRELTLSLGSAKIAGKWHNMCVVWFLQACACVDKRKERV